MEYFNGNSLPSISKYLNKNFWNNAKRRIPKEKKNSKVLIFDGNYSEFCVWGCITSTDTHTQKTMSFSYVLLSNYEIKNPIKEISWCYSSVSFFYFCRAFFVILVKYWTRKSLTFFGSHLFHLFFQQSWR